MNRPAVALMWRGVAIAVLLAIALAAGVEASRGPASRGVSAVCYTLTTTVSAGSGSVLASPASAGACPNGKYPEGYMVAIGAMPAAGFVWNSWSATDNDGTNPTTVTMSSDRTVAAGFRSNCFRLTTVVGSGSGSILAMPASAGGCTTGRYPQGYGVAISGQPAAGWVWNSWSGTDNDSTNPTTVTMDGDRTVAAGFRSNCFRLTTAVGTGSGSVLTSPASAGGCSTGRYPRGYAVAISAQPAGGFIWSSWSGTDNDSTNPTSVTMDADATVTANFRSNCYRLTTAIGSGSGSIRTVPASSGGCPAGRYPRGFMVAVMAEPTAQFLHWSGADSTGNPTTVTMNGDHTVTAFFIGPTATRTRTATPTRTRTPTRTPAPGTPSVTPPPLAAGDASCDGIVNAIDAAVILQASASLLSAVPCPPEADVDENGVIDAIDAALVLQYGAGLVASLPP